MPEMGEKRQKNCGIMKAIARVPIRDEDALHPPSEIPEEDSGRTRDASLERRRHANFDVIRG